MWSPQNIGTLIEKFVKTTIVKCVQIRAEQLELTTIDSRKRYVGLPRQTGWARWAYLGWAKWAYLGWAGPPIYRDGVSTR